MKRKAKKTEERLDQIFQELMDTDCVCEMSAVLTPLPDCELEAAYTDFLVRYSQELALGALERSEWICENLIIIANQQSICFVRTTLDAMRNELERRKVAERSGADQSSYDEPTLAAALDSYTDPASPEFDPAFDEQIRKAGQHWFEPPSGKDSNMNNDKPVVRPRRFSESELKRVQVEIINPYRLVLRCAQCGWGWSPMICAGGRLPRNYWKCPGGCNHDGL
jgi:hypothetical protein